MKSRRTTRRTSAAGHAPAPARSRRDAVRLHPARPVPDEFLRFHGPGSGWMEMEAFVVLVALAAVALPFAVVAAAANAAEKTLREARRGCFRRRAQIDRTFARQCVERLRDLKGSSGTVYRRALRELVAERIRIEEVRSGEVLSGQPGAETRRAAARVRREKAWNKWFKAIERAVSSEGAPSEALLERAPGRRGAPIRRLCERSVLPPPSASDLRAQWEKARGRGRVEEKIRLGSMLLDAEATVDSSLVRDRGGEIVGRRGGLREWLDETCPELARHYAALMGYRRMAAGFRREIGQADPVPAALLLAEEPETERNLPPAPRAVLPEARRKARRLLADADATTAKAFRARLLAMRDARTIPLAGMARRLA